ncbi:MAG TPA: TylF/MycF/NovP-related O-methyltransferase [Flavobacteriales bacterium]|jgi:hypothetical protein|nr:TylF/MycF/NovP-related O-methyltransferase [Flavobacteriales bacterium]
MSFKLKVFRFLKYIFFSWGIYRLVYPFSGFLSTLANMGRLGKFMAGIKHLPNVSPVAKPGSSQRTELYVLVNDGLAGGPVDYLEFGVFQGRSFRWWVEHNTHPDSRFYGFDTFTGLPEDWGGFKAGDMSAGIPDIRDPRVTFVKGLFQDTLPGFIAGWKGTGRKVIHLDADLYTSTLYVLCSLAPYLRAGDVLLYDEFAVPEHEYLAFRNFSDSFRVKYEVIGARNNGLFLAMRIL